MDAIKAGVRKEFGTTLAVYERLVGEGKVEDLFSKMDATNAHQDEATEPGPDSVSLAQQVMDDNTTKLDPREEMEKSGVEEEKKKSKNIFSRFFNKEDKEEKEKE